MVVDPAQMGGISQGGPVPSNQSLPGQAGAPPMVPPGAPPMPPGAQPAPPPKKSAKIVPAEQAQVIAKMYNARKHAMAKFMADSFGLPRGVVDADEETLVRAWLKRDPSVDITELRLSGVSEDEIVDRAYPLRRPLVSIGKPSWKERVEYSDKMAALAQDPKYSHLYEQDEPKEVPEATIPTDLADQVDEETEE